MHTILYVYCFISDFLVQGEKNKLSQKLRDVIWTFSKEKTETEANVKLITGFSRNGDKRFLPCSNILPPFQILYTIVLTIYLDIVHI